jgi:hypothetical protein
MAFGAIPGRADMNRGAQRNHGGAQAGFSLNSARTAPVRTNRPFDENVEWLGCKQLSGSLRSCIPDWCHVHH